MSQTFEQLVAARANFKGRVRQFSNYLSRYDPSVSSPSELKVRLQRFEQLFDKYDQVQVELELLQEEQYKDREQFEDLYFPILANARDFIYQSEQPQEVQPPQAEHNQTQSDISKPILPKIELPRFSGRIEDWNTFIELFNSLVDSNSAIPLIQKHHYLRLALSGTAAKILDSIPITSDNYKVACDLLKQRYDNPRLAVHRHIRNLFNLDPIRTESVIALRNLLDDVQRQVRSLEVLKEPVEQWDTILIYLITSKLDASTLRSWEMEIASTAKPTFKKLCDFLHTRCQVLVSLSQGPELRRSKPIQAQFRSSRVHNVTETFKCVLCDSSHPLYQCSSFKTKTIDERRKFLQLNKRCFNCLSPSHLINNCKSTRNCFYCNQRHHTLLHRPSSNPLPEQSAHVTKGRKSSSKSKISSNKINALVEKSDPQPGPSTSRNSEEVQSMNQNARTIKGSHVLLSTAIVHVQNSKGQWIQARCLLDNAATHDFICYKLVKQLNIPMTETNVNVIGINKGTTNALSYAKIKLRNSQGGNFQFNLNCLVIEHIGSNIPSASYSIDKWKIPQYLKLADPKFNRQAPVELLLGAEMFWKVLQSQALYIQPGVIARSTKLGWILTGKCQPSKFNHSNSQCHFTDVSLQGKLESFWEIEEVPSTKEVLEEEEICENLYQQTTYRNEEGRFVVTMPRKQDFSPVENTRSTALRCFYSIENKLKGDPVAQQQYVNFLDQYEALNHMEVVKTYTPSENQVGHEIVYLSHHPVWKDEVKKDQIRVVFNGSRTDTHGNSLNNTLLTGPTTQADLFSSLAKFRVNKIAVTADIEKMYRQVLINPEQQNLQRILWRASADQPIKIFSLKTVTYGLKPSSFLATRTLKELALQDGHLFCKEAKEALLHYFYVDDYLQSFTSVEEAKKVTSDLTLLLNGGGFSLKKWHSSSKQFLQSVPKQDQALEPYEMYQDNIMVKTLGLFWTPSNDVLSYKVKLKSQPSTTKRSILSEIASIFDPLHLLAPVIVTAKIIMQNLWALKLNWDEDVPPPVLSKWLKYREELPLLTKINIGRLVYDNTGVQKPNLHLFCDSSEKAYGCCAYVVSEKDHFITATLLCAKSKVAPLKKVTLPRLELCGALMAAELKSKLVNCLRVKFNNIFLWTDSMIVLSWLAKPSSNWNTFVANRIEKIHSNTSAQQWRYVPSSENPADVISRGCSPSNLQSQNLYWNGPHWLTAPEEYWPRSSNSTWETTSETQTQADIHLSVVKDEQFMNKFSSWLRLIRVTAYILRWKRKVLDKTQPIETYLSSEELHQATNIILKVTQKQSFAEEYYALSHGSSVPRKSHILSLNPILGEDTLLRVGGRLSHSSLPQDQKHPIILPSNHHVTTLIIRYLHYKNLHAGPRSLLYLVREQYWPVNGLHAVNSVTRKCMVCFKTKPKPLHQLMGDLPAIRVTPQRPFSITGIDYAGPFFLNVSSLKSRKPIPEKAYIVLFVCMVTGAVHLELVTNYSTAMFLAALNRFVSRRGKPSHIYSDNARNFTGAAEELRKSIVSSERQAEIQDFAYQNGIHWHFIPPYHPSMGGRWESLVKIVKQHIKKTVTKLCLRYEEFNSLLISIEGIVNSRPISPLSMDPSDFMPLTPAHFLIGDSFTSLPDSGLKGNDKTFHVHWRQVQELRSQFWSRWKQEYLNLLQRRSKWQTSTPNLKIGDLVMLKDSTKPLVWNLARVVKLHSGSDGLCRIVELRTPSGVITRSINLVSPVPYQRDSSQ